MGSISRLMSIDKVVKYLNTRTDEDFDKDEIIEFIERKLIPIVFKYKGWVTWEFEDKGNYQFLNIEVEGYLNFRNENDAIQLFKGFLTEVSIQEAIIYHLDWHHIRGNKPKDIELKEGDGILFKSGGRSPTFNLSDMQNFIKIDSRKVGVLEADLKSFLKKMNAEYVDDKTEIEALKLKVENLETENVSLIQQLKEAQSTHPEELLDPKDSAYTLIAILKDLLLDPDIAAYHFKTDNNNSTNKPTQTGLANYIDDMQIFGIKKDNINILLQEANKKLKDAHSKARDKPTKL